MWAPANSKYYYESLNMLRENLFLGWKSGHQPLHKDYFCTNYRKQLKQNFPAYYKTFLVGWKICNFAMPWNFRQKKNTSSTMTWQAHEHDTRNMCLYNFYQMCLYVNDIEHFVHATMSKSTSKTIFCMCYKQGNKIVQIFSFAIEKLRILSRACNHIMIWASALCMQI